MSPVFIYSLNDPRTGETRYLGQAVDPDRRLVGHLSDLKRRTHYSANWIRSLLDAGLKPIMEILDVVPDNEADFWEREYIQNFRERGFDLTNGTDGGDCGPSRLGKKNTPEHNEKIRASLIGRKHSPERRANIGAAQVGRKHSPAHCAAISTALTGEKNPFFGKNHTPEVLAKLRSDKLGKKRGPYKKKNVLSN